MWDGLPEDLQREILRVRAALLVQRTWRRYVWLAHARRIGWTRVRDDLEDDWRWMVRLPGVRREWRTEASSWLGMDSRTRGVIRAEAEVGLWGKCTVVRK